MQNLSMCRICLASDVRLCSIASSLQDMYEKLTELTFKREDRRPLVACYICYARLRNCYRLRTCSLRSDELLTEMLSSGELVPPQVSSTNTLSVVSVLQLSLGHVLQDCTECHVKEEALEVTYDVGLDQQTTEDIKMEPQEAHDAQTADNIQCSHIEYSLDVMKREADDVESDAEDIKFKTEDIIIEENEPHDASQSSLSACNTCPKNVKVVLERMVLNDTIPATDEDIKFELEDAVLKENESNSVGGSSHSMDNIRPKIAEVVLERKIIPATGVPALKKLLVTDTEDINKRFVLDKLMAKSNINRTVDQLDATLDKHSRNNKVTAKYEVHKQTSSNICSIKKCYRSKAHSERQTNTHTGEKRFQCDVCNRCFQFKIYLTRHMYSHTGEKPFQCNICNKCFQVKFSLTQHLYTHSSEKRFQCDVCNECFHNRSNLTRHILYTHTGEKKFQCDVCNKCFKMKCTLTRHMCTHTGEKPFQCDVCNKCFKMKCTLTRHMCTHTGEKPFQCDVCNKFFKRKCTLTEHLYAHTGKKPFQCSVCNKCFSRKSFLTRHMYTHTGEKPFQCHVCNKCFKKKSTLKQHMCAHTGD